MNLDFLVPYSFYKVINHISYSGKHLVHCTKVLLIWNEVDHSTVTYKFSTTNKIYTLDNKSSQERVCLHVYRIRPKFSHAI